MLACPYAKYDQKKRVECTKLKNLCGFVFFCQLSMKWKQTDKALICPLREEKEEIC